MLVVIKQVTVAVVVVIVAVVVVVVVIIQIMLRVLKVSAEPNLQESVLSSVGINS